MIDSAIVYAIVASVVLHHIIITDGIADQIVISRGVWQCPRVNRRQLYLTAPKDCWKLPAVMIVKHSASSLSCWLAIAWMKQQLANNELPKNVKNMMRSETIALPFFRRFAPFGSVLC